MADSNIERAVLDKPVGTVAHAESAAGYHIVEVLSESEPVTAPSAGTTNVAQVPRIINASVRDLADVLQDGAMVCLYPRWPAAGRRTAWALLLHSTQLASLCDL